MSTTFSFIIPVKSINEYVRENIANIQQQDYPYWDTIILPNSEEPDEWCDTRIRIIPTGRIPPSRKRDIGVQHSSSDVVVFLDDDSFPNYDLLSVAKSHFADEGCVAIGGPGITPPNNSFWQKVSGASFLSRASGGFPERYIPVGKSKMVDDWPSVNLMVRRDYFLEVGGFDTDFWPGEDTILCKKLNANGTASVKYVPDLIVWHHRREGILRHLKQIGEYARHRGYFTRRHPDNSLKLIYFIPTCFVGFSFLSCFWAIIPEPFNIGLPFVWAAYVLALVKSFADIAKIENTRVAAFAMAYVILTHYWYGICFAVGLCGRAPKPKLR